MPSECRSVSKTVKFNTQAGECCDGGGDGRRGGLVELPDDLLDASPHLRVAALRVSLLQHVEDELDRGAGLKFSVHAGNIRRGHSILPLLP